MTRPPEPFADRHHPYYTNWIDRDGYGVLTHYPPGTRVLHRSGVYATVLYTFERLAHIVTDDGTRPSPPHVWDLRLISADVMPERLIAGDVLGRG